MDSTYSDCCEFEPRGSPPLKQRDAVQVTWNMSESNVPVHSSTYTALRRFPEKRVDCKYNPGARFRQNLCGERGVAKSKDPDRVARQGSVPLKYKAPPRLQRHKTTLQSTQQPVFTQKPTTDDQPREGQFNSDHFTASSSDLIEGDRVRKPEVKADGYQGGNRGNAVMDEIEAEMGDVLDSLFQSQYNIAIRVEALKEDLMRQVARLQAPPKPVSFVNEPIARPVAKWAGTYYDYIMMVGFMVVQFVFQFVIVRKY
ncbi:unnamed protein product [Lymnaea stagnalis]|uniref:Uncharacterized protein n=1 Tax=Lymnaea stagnalis TaxID=6523 RepID=A0AAV2HTP7_LYMST